ncbi:hypothetical protein ABXN37_14455 [Piscinibacter sakaiensis]|uniref:Uncharacterized protein n=1 Tax=Piscinibacter sakaiensis TaxID=1547922 RepID=A0A0K8P109_PISS1|nr:hypothetical protein [Piscinibacter sakaiensis]GAP36347.1 hypothetical protein ISF6_2187 [Piscinibacter sakaiensis]
MLSAFHGDVACRDLALARLDERFQANGLTLGALFIGGGKATPAAALIGSSDAQHWEDSLGLARWLAYAIDFAYSDLPPVQGVAFVRSLLNAIPLGDDTTRTGSRFIETVLSEVLVSLGKWRGHADELTAACEEIRALHRRAASGDMPAGAHWRTARRLATDATNALNDDVEKLLGGCVEAAAWDPMAAPTTAGDVLRTWNKAEGAGVDAAFGWTKDDDARVRAHLADMFERFKKGKTEEEEPRDVFQLLRHHHPELEARLLAYTRCQREFGAAVARRTADLLMRVVGTAP